MKLFGKIKGGNSQNSGRNLIGEKLDSIGRTVQAGWAGWMERTTAGMGRKAWIAAMLCLICCVGGYSSYLILRVFTTKPVTVIQVAKIRKSTYSGQTGEPKAIAKISEAEYERIVKFHKYMDSLAARPETRSAYDSLTRLRPGLLDSIKQVEQYYQQLKEK